MSDLDDNQEVEEIVEPSPEVDEGPTPEQLAAQEEASKYGWRPKESFDKDPNGWVDADRFLELPSTNVKKMRDEAKALREENERMAADTATRLENIERMNKVAMDRALKAQSQQYEREQETLRNQQREAVEVGDVAKFDQIEQQRSTLKAPEPIAPQTEPPKNAPIPEVEKYKAENTWTQDPVMWNFARDAVGANPAIVSQAPSVQLAYAEKTVKDLFPHKFEAPKAKRQMVDGGGFGAPSGGKKAVNSLPSEAIKQGKEFVEEGYFKSLDDYAKAYFEQDQG